MTRIEINLQQGNNGIAVLNPIDGLNIQKDSLLKIYDVNEKNWVVLKTFLRSDAPRDTIVGDSNILEGLGLQGSDIVEIEPFKGKVEDAEELSIEFTSLDRPPKELFLPQNQAKMLNFLQNYFLSEITEVYWPERNTTFRIQVITPKIEPSNVYRIPNDVRIKLRQQIQSMPFNAVLLIDKSRSMARKDVILEGSENVLDDLWQNFFPSTFDPKTTPYPHLLSWFKILDKNRHRLRAYYDYIKNTEEESQNSASRLDSVLLSTILFFQEKISRGYGEKCAFVLYSDEAKVIEFQGKSFIDATEFSAKLCEDLIYKIKERVYLGYGNTNISSAILYCKNIALEYRKLNDNPLMILLLSDGSPFPPEIDSETNVLHSIAELKIFFDTNNIPFVLYTIAMGEETKMCEDLLIRVANIGNGEFHYVSNIMHLIEWYRKLAKDFTYTIASNKHV